MTAGYISPPPGPDWERRWPRPLAVLGSTGSIGRSALEVVRLHRDRFPLAALAGGRNIRLLAGQAAEFRPPCLGIQDGALAGELRALLPPGYNPEILSGQSGYERLAALPEAGLILSAQAGAAGLRATVAAAAAGKVIALANKESLVLAGDLLRRLCAARGGSILPVDSEHNALFQCLAGRDTAAVSRLILTASGGPFRGWSRRDLLKAGPEKALAHPTWAMGAKITVDSATLMNKGLEVLEAGTLFGMPLSSIEVLVHKESLVHSLVEFSDSSLLALLGVPDMRLPLAHCLGLPGRLSGGVPRLDLAKAGGLTFEEPDLETFPCLALARQAGEAGGGSRVVLNAANEIAVEAFLGGDIRYLDIAPLIERALDWGAPSPNPDCLEAILELDACTRFWAKERIAARGGKQRPSPGGSLPG
jgi:1-deoxy-D-xylulose-5-phosphate reductoisomerase